jgi:hypothetical protein
MRLRGQRSRGPALALLIVIVIVLTAIAAYVLYLAPR